MAFQEKIFQPHTVPYMRNQNNKLIVYKNYSFEKCSKIWPYIPNSVANDFRWRLYYVVENECEDWSHQDVVWWGSRQNSLGDGYSCIRVLRSFMETSYEGAMTVRELWIIGYSCGWDAFELCRIFQSIEIVLYKRNGLAYNGFRPWSYKSRRTSRLLIRCFLDRSIHDYMNMQRKKSTGWLNFCILIRLHLGHHL